MVDLETGIVHHAAAKRAARFAAKDPAVARLYAAMDIQLTENDMPKPTPDSAEPLQVFTVTHEDGSTSEIGVPPRLIRKFERICADMAALLKDWSLHAPEGGLYLEGAGNPHLMVGPSHIGLKATSVRDNVATTGEDWCGASGGGW